MENKSPLALLLFFFCLLACVPFGHKIATTLYHIKTDTEYSIQVQQMNEERWYSLHSEERREQLSSALFGCTDPDHQNPQDIDWIGEFPKYCGCWGDWYETE